MQRVFQRYFQKGISNPVTITTPKRTRIKVGGENTITAADVSLAVKTLKTRKAAGCDEIQSEMLIASNRGLLSLTHVCPVAWCSRRAPKDWQTGVIIPYTRRVTGLNALTTGASPTLNCIQSALKKDVTK